MKIDYTQAIKSAQKMGISQYTIIKRLVNYREAEKKDFHVCKLCKYLNYVKYKDFIDFKINCKIIGESIEPEAEIKYNHKCNLWESINN